MTATYFRLAPGDQGIAQTVGVLHAYASRPSVLVRETAEAILAQVPSDPPSRAAALLRWVQTHVRYLPDKRYIEEVPDPEYLLRRMRELGGIAYSDCDGQVALLAALADSINLPYRYIVVSQLPTPDDLSHIYLEFALPGLGWVPADPSNIHAPLGWAPLNIVRKEVLEL